MTSEQRFARIEKTLADLTVFWTTTFQQLAQIQSESLDADFRTAQRLDQITEKLDRVAGDLVLLAEAQRHTEDRLNGLIGYVEGMERRPPQ